MNLQHAEYYYHLVMYLERESTWIHDHDAGKYSSFVIIKLQFIEVICKFTLFLKEITQRHAAEHFPNKKCY